MYIYVCVCAGEGGWGGGWLKMSLLNFLACIQCHVVEGERESYRFFDRQGYKVFFLYTTEMSYSGGMSGGSGMRPTSPRSTFGQQNPTGGYPPGGQGGASGQYGKSELNVMTQGILFDRL